MKKTKLRPWKRIAFKWVGESRYMRLGEARYEIPGTDKKPVKPFLFCDSFVRAIALHGNQFVLVRQYRPATKRFTIEFPGGDLLKREPPLRAGARELEEETGYKPSVKGEYWGGFQTGAEMPAFVHFAFFSRTKKTAVNNMEDEKTETVFATPKQLVKLALSGQMRSNDLAALALLKQYKPRLFR